MTLLGPGPAPAQQGREVFPYWCQSRSSAEHMKGRHSRFYGWRWLHKPLRSEVMWPVGRINNASLIRAPPTKTPGGRGAGENPEQRVLRLRRANHHPREHFYWKEFIYQRCPSLYFPEWGGRAERQARITLRTRGCLQRYAGDSVHQLWPLLSSLIPSQLRRLFFI